MLRVILLIFLVIASSGRTTLGGVFNPETITLPNGLQIVVTTNRAAPAIVHMVWYRVGAADEPSGSSGLAHFLEHLMFKGTKSIAPGQFSKIIARNGGTDNAFTSQDFTAYFQKVSREGLELVMKLESDRMKNLILTDREVLPERDVVLEERSSRTDNSPQAQLYEAVQAALYFNHPYGNPVIGWKHEISTLSTTDALNFYRKFYAPNNAILIISGDVSMSEVRPLAEKYYGPIARGPKIDRVRVKEPIHRAARRVVLEDKRVGQSSFNRIYTAPSYKTASGNEGYALQILADILGGGPRSRLHRKLVVTKKTASSVGAWYNPSALDIGEFGLSARPRGEITLRQIEEEIDAELLDLKENGVKPEEVRRSAESLTVGAVYARDSIAAAPNIIGRALTTGQTLEDIEAWPERILSVTEADVRAVAEKVLVVRNSVTGLLRAMATEVE
ncbi:MAG: pitrilysin family protein [Rhodospirillaceae bacterium]